MIKNIKSTFTLKIIFSFMDDKSKLQLVKYNKRIQNILNINLLHYKLFSGKYLILEENGYGKEYDSYNDNILFEGEYINRKRNGKGKEYSSLQLVFEGEYFNGKRNGQGKEYDDFNHKIIFEGEYSNGKRLNGKGYDGNGNVIYELIGGKGIIKEFHFGDRIKYEGEYLNGKGKEYYFEGAL